MRFVATRAFRNNCELEIKGALHPDHVHKSAVFSIGGDLPLERLTPSEQNLVSQLRSAECICDADDAERVRVVGDEIATEEKREKRARKEPWIRAHKIQVIQAFLAGCAVVAAIIMVILALRRH